MRFNLFNVLIATVCARVRSDGTLSMTVTPFKYLLLVTTKPTVVNLYKQFGHRIGPTGLIWMQTDGISEICIFEKRCLKRKSADNTKSRKKLPSCKELSANLTFPPFPFNFGSCKDTCVMSNSTSGHKITTAYICIYQSHKLTTAVKTLLKNHNKSLSVDFD